MNATKEGYTAGWTNAVAGGLVHMGADERFCNCGTRLRRNNSGRLCETCQRSHQSTNSAPIVPAEFWDNPAMREALATWHIGKVVTAYRHHPFHGKILVQEQVGIWVGMAQTQMSRLEGGPIVEDLSKLRMWARVLKIPESVLWFKIEKGTVASKHAQDARASITENVIVTWFESSSVGNGTCREIGADDVEIVREMVQTFRRLDNRFGGGRARSLVNNFLTTEVAPILHDGTFRNATRENFFGTVADLNQLAGWMAYDVGDAGSGQRHLRHALRLSQEVGDYARSSEMLSGLSHHAAFLRIPELAISYAEGAQQQAHKSGLAMLEAESAVMAAHGFAIKGDAPACQESLRRAERSFGSADRTKSPEWLKYLDEAYLAAKFAHCFREIGILDQAEGFARRSLEMSEGYHRGRLFNTALLASILVDRGNIEEACMLSLTALEMASRMQSDRTTKYLSDVMHKLTAHSALPRVSEVLETYTQAGIRA